MVKLPPLKGLFKANDARLVAVASNERLQEVLKMIKAEAKKGEVSLHLRMDVHEDYISDITLRRLLEGLNYGLSSFHLADGMSIYWYN